VKYTKVPLSNAALLARWQEKGLAVPSVIAAERALNFIGYFRLRGYALSLMISTPAGRMFQPEVSFEDVIARYEFDRVLRRITLGQLERIAVAVLGRSSSRSLAACADLAAQYLRSSRTCVESSLCRPAGCSSPSRGTFQRSAKLLLFGGRHAAVLKGS